MRKQALFWSCIVACAAMVSATITGCGGLECADGTVEVDGECMMSPEFDCPEGEVYDEAEGGCVIKLECGPNTTPDEQERVCVADEPVNCGENAELDPNENECYATDAVCDENTSYSDEAGGCVPTDKICVEGTYFDDDTGLCYPSAVCQPGDVIVDGLCYTELEERALNADVVADDITDPAFGGEPLELELGDDPVDFTGVIGEPEDLDGDGLDNQHIDVFEIDAEAGDVIDLTVRSLGLPNPAFQVSAHDAEIDEFDRYSLDRPTNSSSRTIVFPVDGTYRVTVKPGALKEDSAQPLGADDWEYLGTVDKLDDLEIEPHDFETENLTGQLDGYDDNFVLLEDLTEGEGEVFRLEWTSLPDTTDATLLVWDGEDGEFVGEFDGEEFAIEVPETEQLALLPDWRSHSGGAAMDFAIAGEEAFNLVPGAEFETTFTADSHDAASISFDHNATGSLDITVIDEDGNVVKEDSTTRVGTVDVLDLAGGDYTVEYYNDTSSAFELFEPEVDVISPTQEATFNVDEGDLVEIEQDNDSFDSIDMLVVHTSSDDTVFLEEGFGRFSTLEFEVGSEYTGDHTVYYYEFDPSDPVDDLEITVELGLLQTLDSFQASDGDMVGFYQTNDDDDTVDYWVVDDDTDEQVSAGSLNDDSPLFIDAETIGGPGDYTVMWYNWGDVAGLDFQAVSTGKQEVTDVDISLSEYDASVISQTNADDGEVVAVLEHDASGEVIFSHVFEDSEEYLHKAREHTGDFTLYRYDFGFFSGVQFTEDHVQPGFLDEFDTTDPYYRVGITQTNIEDVDLELILVHDDGGDTEVFEEATLADDDAQEFDLGDRSGDFIIWWYDYGEVDEDDVDVEVEDVPPVVGTSFNTDPYDVVHITQDNADDEDIDIFIVEDASGERVYEHDGMSTSDTVEFAADADADYTVYWYDYDVIDAGVTMDAAIYTPDDDVQLSPDAQDVIHVTQSNDDDESIGVVVVDDATGDIVVQDNLSTSDEIKYFVSEAGSYTVYWIDYEAADNLDVQAEVIAPSVGATFTVGQFDYVEISQTNPDDVALEIRVVEDSTSEVWIEEDALGTGDIVDFMAAEAGDYTVFWYDYGEVDEDDVTFITDIASPTLLETFTVDHGDVIRLTQDNPGGDSVDLMVFDENGNLAAEDDSLGTDSDDLLDIYGSVSGTHYVYTFDGGADTDVTAEIHSPTMVTNFNQTYSGTGLTDGIAGPHDYYLVELNTTTTYDITLEGTGGSGWPRVTVFQVVNEYIDEHSSHAGSSPQTLTVEFEAGESYVLRVGGEYSSGWSFDYDLWFDEV